MKASKTHILKFYNLPMAACSTLLYVQREPLTYSILYLISNYTAPAPFKFLFYFTILYNDNK